MAEPIPPQLPHVIIEEPKRSKVALLGIIVVSLLLFAIPVGVFLTLQNQNPTSKALQSEELKPETRILFETEKDQVGVGSIFPVRVIVKSDSENANIISIESLFPQNLLEIMKIEVLPDEDAGYTSIPNARIVQQKYSNLSGALTLIVGVPEPGIKTFSDKKIGVATVYFRAKDIGNAKITLENQTAIFSSMTKKNILTNTENDFSVSISSDTPTENALSEENEPVVSQSSDLKILTPNGGETFEFTEEIPIRWNLDEKRLASVTVSLFMNGKLFGVIAKQIPNKREFVLKPETVLQPIFANDSNTFQIQIEGKSNNGQNLLALSEGPFGVYTTDEYIYEASPSASILNTSKDLNNDSELNFSDLSEVFAQFGKTDETALKVDLNGDKAINEIDVWIYKRTLVSNGLIKE